MELWSRLNDFEYSEYSDEEYREQLENDGQMDCGIRKETIGLFETKERALEDLEMMHEDQYDSDREISFAFIRERAMYCMMNPGDYLKEWTYKDCQLIDESIVRNYAEDENHFYGRPKEMIRFKRGDIVMVPDGYSGHWGIICDVPITKEYIKEVNDKIERETVVPGEKYSIMDWTDDCYTILTSAEDYMHSHEHISAHHVIPALIVPEFVRKTLEEGLRKVDD